MKNNINIRVRLIVIKNDKLLSYYDSIDDYYFYIGGKLEYGETIKECWTREVKEELGEDVTFTFKKVLYIRDFIIKEKNEHSLEIFILGDINKFEEIEKRPDPEFGGKKWPTWLDLKNLPDNLYPRPLSKKVVEDYAKGFPKEGEYVGLLDVEPITPNT